MAKRARVLSGKVPHIDNGCALSHASLAEGGGLLSDDVGQAFELAREVDASDLSPERQARILINLAQAQAMRRHIDDALHSLEQPERPTPEQIPIVLPAR